MPFFLKAILTLLLFRKKTQDLTVPTGLQLKSINLGVTVGGTGGHGNPDNTHSWP